MARTVSGGANAGTAAPAATKSANTTSVAGKTVDRQFTFECDRQYWHVYIRINRARWAGDEYPDWWVPIARLTADLRPVARRLERLKYAEADAAPDPAPSRRAERRLAALKVNSENAGNSRSVRARATECGEPPSRETRSLAWMWAELL